MPAHCHIQIREVAKAAAGELYERMMGDNQFNYTWRDQNPGANARELERRFIEKNWPKCIAFARATLAQLLTKPDVPEATKARIMDVLIKDNSLQRGRRYVG